MSILVSFSGNCVLYWSFDTLDDLTVMEGVDVGNSSGVLVEGLVKWFYFN